MSEKIQNRKHRTGDQVVIHGSSKLVVETLRDTLSKARASIAKVKWQDAGESIIAYREIIARMRCAAAIGEDHIKLDSPVLKPVAMKLRYTAGLNVSPDLMTISLF